MDAPEAYTLTHPIQFGSETISELQLKPSAGAFKGFSQVVRDDGSVVFDPYALALVAVRMAGKAPAVADKLHPADMNRLAQVAMSFLVGGHETGKTP